MGGKVGALEGALLRLRELLATPTHAGALEKALAGPGERFLSGYAGPGAYQKGASFAELSGLGQQFEMGRPQKIADNPSTYRVMDPRSGDAGHFEIVDYPTLLSNYDNPTFDSGVLPFVQSGRLPPDAKYVHADTRELGKGTGAGRRFYGMLYGALSKDQGAYNFSDTLTRSNVHRRSVNMADAMGRDPSLGRRILLSKEQLETLPLNPVRGAPQVDPVNFSLDWAPEAQMGGLQALGSEHTLQGLQGALDALNAGASPYKRALASSTENPSFQDLVERAYGDPAPSPELFGTLAHRLRGLGLGQSVGSASLRKARVLDDALVGRETDPELFHHLGFRRGGSAP